MGSLLGQGAQGRGAESLQALRGLELSQAGSCTHQPCRALELVQREMLLVHAGRKPHSSHPDAGSFPGWGTLCLQVPFPL